MAIRSQVSNQILSTTGSPTFANLTLTNPLPPGSGGTGIQSATAYSLIAAGTTSTGAWQSVGAGSAGQFLQSGGASALPAWTTATFPASAGTSGTILRSNGTNWVNSTSVFSDTYSASALLYSNGTNNVEGLATANRGFLVTSTSGVPSISNTITAVEDQSTNGAAGTPTLLINNSTGITYPSTSGFAVTLGQYSNVLANTSQTINSSTPGGFPFVYGNRIVMTYSDNGTNDLSRLALTALGVNNTWSSTNTAFQVAGAQIASEYQGANVGGRTASAILGATLTGRVISPASSTVTILTLTGANGLAVISNQSNTGIVQTITTVSGCSGSLTVASPAASNATSITNLASFDARPASLSATGAGSTLAITNLYGLRLQTPTIGANTTITNRYGVFSEDASAINYFAGSVQIGTPLSVAYGGTGIASATAYSLMAAGTTSTGAWQSIGTGVAGQLLQSGGSSALPSYTTATFPSTATSAGKILRADGTNWVASTSNFADTYSASTLLYSNGANNVAGLATANSAVLVTNSSGVPAWSSTMTNGQIIIGSTSGTPTAAAITAGSGISVTNGAGSITIASTGAASGGFAFNSVSGTTQTAVAGNAYILNNASATTVTLPASGSSTIGDTIKIKGRSSAAFVIQANTGQVIKDGSVSSTTAGTATSAAGTDSIQLVYVASNEWSVDWQLSSGFTLA